MESLLVYQQGLAQKDATQRTLVSESNYSEPTKEDQAMASTKNIVDRHLNCFFEGDLDGILSDYAPGAVFFTRGGTLRGEDEIRSLFETMIAEFEKPGATFSLKQKFIEAEYAYILWAAESADHIYELGTDTFIVQNGKIVAQSFSCKMTHKG